MCRDADDGMDEISIAGATQVAEWQDGSMHRYQVTPEQFGMTRGDVAALAVDSVEQSLSIVKAVLAGQAGPAKDIVALNAGAAIYAADLAETLEAGIAKAQEVIDSGAALAKLDALVVLSNSLN